MTNKPLKDRFYQIPERALLYAFNNLSESALRLYLVLAGQKSGFIADIELYCKRAKIPFKEYSIYERELIDKKFLVRENDNLKVQCPLVAYTINYDATEINQEQKSNDLKYLI